MDLGKQFSNIAGTEVLGDVAHKVNLMHLGTLNDPELRGDKGKLVRKIMRSMGTHLNNAVVLHSALPDSATHMDVREVHRHLSNAALHMMPLDENLPKEGPARTSFEKHLHDIVTIPTTYAHSMSDYFHRED
jgi:hypothetical protein